MASINGPFDFEGPFGNMSAYKMYGSDKVILRQKGGPSKDQIKNAPEFARTRELNTEHQAGMLLTGGIRHALFPVMHLGDPQFTGRLNALGKRVQVQDTVSERGKRNMYFSRCRYMLQGFSLNDIQVFESIVRHPITVRNNREERSSGISIPALIPEVNLFPVTKDPYYRLVISLGIVSDVVFQNGMPMKEDTQEVQIHYTDWTNLGATFPATNIELQLETELTESMSLLLAIGVEMGRKDPLNDTRTVKRAGSAKVLGVF